MKFVVMIFFRHIKLSSGLIGKDVKVGEKFHTQQLFDGHIPGEEVLYLPMLCASARPVSAGQMANR